VQGARGAYRPRTLHAPFKDTIMQLSDPALDQMFRQARSCNGWSDRPVGRSTIEAIHDLARMGPTSANSNPARFVWVTSPPARERLALCAMGPNADKIRKAPVTVIIARDMDFAEHMPRLFPHNVQMQQMMLNPAVASATAIRNTTLQGAWLMMAARALGLDCGPISGFDPGKVTAGFLTHGRLEPDFLCSLGYGNGQGMFERLPRLSFADAGLVV
jgi:3-hydroxypropanoate dehydrogenase